MIHGADTGFLVAAELQEHARHAEARATIVRLVQSGDRMALTPQVIAEFLHNFTDGRRFSEPLSMSRALEVAEKWWSAREVVHVFSDSNTVRDFLGVLRQHRLGRKRLLDTLLAATLRRVGINSILTTDAHDFVILGLQIVEPTV